MARKDKTLKAALDREKGVNHKLDHQKKLQKQAEKRKRKASEISGGPETETAAANALASGAVLQQELAADAAEAIESANGQAEGWETDEEEEADGEEMDGLAQIGELSDESGSDSDDDGPIHNETAEDEDEEDIALSDIESLDEEEKGDVIPYQRLTINNTAALQRSLKSFALPSSLPFSAVQAVTSAEPIDIPDVEDDLNRELAFYKQSLDAVKEARILLKKEGVAFSRPTDFFAEMVKSEELMGKVKAKMVDEAARKKASSDARRQRDLKKFGKQVQVAKLQERDRTKRETMDKISLLKRKRQGGNDLTAKEDDMFDVALEDAATTARKDKADRRAQGAKGGKGAAEGSSRKRQKKDEKFGFGGKKRFGKSNDAKSSGDMSGFSTKRMKDKKGGKPRLGKSKRARV